MLSKPMPQGISKRKGPQGEDQFGVNEIGVIKELKMMIEGSNRLRPQLQEPRFRLGRCTPLG